MWDLYYGRYGSPYIGSMPFGLASNVSRSSNELPATSKIQGRRAILRMDRILEAPC